MEPVKTFPCLSYGIQRERTVLIDKYLKRWNSTADITTNGKPIDAIIMPATPFAGNPLREIPHMLATHPHLMLLIILLVCSGDQGR